MSSNRNIRYIGLTVLLLSIACGAGAQGRRFNMNPVNHFITLSLGGGEGNTLSSFTIPDSKDLVGADALFGLGYELRKNSFYFGFGAQADFDLTRQQLGAFVEAFQKVDFENDPHTYSYRYTRFTDVQRNLQVGVPVYFGYYFNPYVYGMLGAKFCYSFWMTHTATTDLSTDGTYARFAEPITERDRYGFYPIDTYTYSGPTFGEMKVGPTLEVGAKVPFYTASRRIGLRVGVYAEYLIPLNFTNDVPLVDYSRVESDPNKLNQADLKTNIVFNSAITSPYQKRAAHNLAVGVKLTLLFNVTPVHKMCNCDNDMGVHPVRSVGAPRGRIMKD